MPPSHIRILLLEANPWDLAPLHTLAEAKNLKRLLEPLGFQVELAPALQVEELQTLLREHTPDILHFAGHGDQAGNLQAQDEDGNAVAIPMDALAEAVRIHNSVQNGSLRLIVLNACFSARQAEQLARHVECVVAAHEPIHDRSAIAFAEGFYGSLAGGSSVDVAFECGYNQDDLRGLPPVKESLELLTRFGVDANQVFFTKKLTSEHEDYLRHWFFQSWASIPLRLFGRPDGDADLLDVYVPLPVAGSLVFHDPPEQVDPVVGIDWSFNPMVGIDMSVFAGAESRADAELERVLSEGELSVQMGEASSDKLLRRKPLRTHHWASLDADEESLRPLVARANSRREPNEEEGDAYRLVAEDAAALQRRFVLVGDPGSGKSSFLRHLTLSLSADLLRRSGATCPQAEAVQDRSFEWLPAGVTPVYIELHSFFTMPALQLPEDERAQPVAPSLGDFWTYLEGRLRPMGVGHVLPELRRLYDAGDLLILLDGLDEVNNAAHKDRRWQIKRLVSTLARSDNRVIITSRPFAYRSSDWMLDGFGRTDLIDLRPAQRIDLTNRLFVALAPDDDGQAQALFLDELESVRADLLSTPLFFTLLAAIWLRPPHPRRLPETRGELYRRAIDLLLDDWVHEKDGEFSLPQRLELTSDELRCVLQVLALMIQQRSEPESDTTIFDDGDLHRAIRHIKMDRRETRVVTYVEQMAGVLQDVTDELEREPGLLISPEPRSFRFLHRSFQEHLAACELIGGDRMDRPHHQFPDVLVDLVLQKQALWRNVAELAADELRYQGRGHDLDRLLQALSAPYRRAKAKNANGEESTPLADGDGSAALLTLTIAREQEMLQTSDAGGLAATISILRETATHALADFETFSPEERDIAGIALALLGDQRPGVGLRSDGLPDIDWVEIPEIDAATGQREFIYQEDEPRTEPTFWMARYPVTSRQFQAFLDADDGFYNDEWWSGISASEEHRSTPGQQEFKHWNHPRERVSWYDAIAFCHWLTAKASASPDLAAQLPPPGEGMAWSFTLPTEWQWEKAARGYDGRIFPWGDEYVSGFANINETYSSQRVGDHYLRKTSAVDMYPQGMSPYGIHDTSGNVWEWCLNEYSNPDNVRESGSERRTLRGGSWVNDHVDARSVRRFYDLPDFRYQQFPKVGLW